MTYVEKVIHCFGGIRAMAKVLGHVNPSTVQTWKTVNRIPPWREYEIREAAKRENIVLPERSTQLENTTPKQSPSHDKSDVAG